jgi:hypothetical protein
MNEEILFTSHLLANLLIAGLVMLLDIGLFDLLVCLFPPVYPATFPPFPFPACMVIFLFELFYVI